MNTPVPDDTLLGLLCLRPAHGYELLHRFQDRGELGAVWQMSTSQLYKVLKRLDDGGWITGEHRASALAPERMEYAITEAGRARLEAWLNESHPSASVRAVRVEFLSRLVIGRALGWPLDDLIAAQRAACAHRLDELQRSRARAAAPNEPLALDLVIGQTNALLQWIDQSVSEFSHPGRVTAS